MATSWLAAAQQRALLSLTTLPPTFSDVMKVGAITVGTTALAGIFCKLSGFIDPVADFEPPWQRPSRFHWSLKPISAFIFPSLFEEILWRGILIAPHPSTATGYFTPELLRRSSIVLMAHVAMHPVAGYTCWPRGRKIFCDWRFLVSATIVLGGATLSYLVSGGSVWAAALTHGLAVALWRDFFGGEAQLMQSATDDDATNSEEERLENDNV